MEALTQYDWPGNIRELENVIERGLAVSRNADFSLGEPLGTVARVRRLPENGDGSPPLESLNHIERCHILDVLNKCHWKIKGKGNAAEVLGLNPSTLRFRMRKLQITRPE